MRLFLLFLLFVLPYAAFGQMQSAGYPPNVIRIYPLSALTTGHLTFAYERMLTDRISLGCGLRFWFLHTDSESDHQTAWRSDYRNQLDVTGFALLPEFRWYASKKKVGPYGFFVGATLPLTFLNVVIEDEIGDNQEWGRATAPAFVLGIGPQAGWQWRLGEHFTLDLLGGVNLGFWRINNINVTREDGRVEHYTEADLAVKYTMFSFAAILPLPRLSLGLGYAF